jgi:hypothetical protein
LASTDASVPAPIAHSSILTCTNRVRSGSAATTAGQLTVGNWKASIFDDCPMCAKPPVEPVRVDGQLACRACTSACTICGSACVPGDDACTECVRHVGLDRAAA